MKTTNTEWKNCPFCGAEITQANVTTEAIFDEVWASHNDKGCVAVKCPECTVEFYHHDDYGAKTPPATYEELVEGLRRRWNTRRRKAVRKETEE